MPTYNSEGYIKNTLNSIFFQTYSNWEVLITDDCSTDGTWEFLEGISKKDDRIKIFKLRINSGPAIARNYSISKAKGRFIAFLDSDDIWYPDKLKIQLNFMLENEFTFTFTAYDKINEEGNYVGSIKAPAEVTYNDLLKTCSIGCLTVIYDTSKIGKIYMPLIKKRQDFALWLKILKIIPKAYGLNTPLSKYRIMSNSVSSNKFKASNYQWKVYREIENLSVISSIYYFVYYSVNGLIKTYLK